VKPNQNTFSHNGSVAVSREERATAPNSDRGHLLLILICKDVSSACLGVQQRVGIRMATMAFQARYEGLPVRRVSAMELSAYADRESASTTTSLIGRLSL
jgi:hypothetical protein